MERFYDGKSLFVENHDGCSTSDSISDEEIVETSKLLATSASNNFGRSDYACSGSKYQEEACTWSMAFEDVKELACLQARPCASKYVGHLSDGKKRSRGDKPKFSIRSHLHVEADKKKMLSEVTFDDLDGENIVDDKLMETPVATLAGCSSRDDEELPLKLVCQDSRGAALPSVAKLLEDLQEIDDPIYGRLNLDDKSRKQKNVCSWTRTTTPLGTTLEDEDPLEYAGAGTSSDDEDCHSNQLSLVNVKKNQSMTGIFQEAFSNCSYLTDKSACYNINRQTGIGYYGRLQQILQKEKDTILNFSQTKKMPFCDVSCLSVRILSRYLEAKLTVCHCLLGENLKTFEQKNTTEKCPEDLNALKRTVIFSSRLSCDVELEVGNIICIHQPWKEVLVDNGDVVILSSYFTQFIADLPAN